MKIKAYQIADVIESIAPLNYQESYDNSGWIVGTPQKEVEGVLISLDMTLDVVDEAIDSGCNLIITHHPLIFKPLKKVIAGNQVDDIVMKAIRHDIMIYSTHTSMDNAWHGVNAELASRLDLQDFKILRPLEQVLKKVVVFVPEDYANTVREAMFAAGAGAIGEYDSCSYNLRGRGSFRAGENANPFVGDKQELHFESEERVETVVPEHLLNPVVNAMEQAHPYEEVAYDIYPLENKHDRAGAGAIGEFRQSMPKEDFLDFVKDRLQISQIRYGGYENDKIGKVAVAGGAGSFLIPDAIKSGADVFITADLKYHDFFRGEGKILLVDAGHYETEQFTKHLLRDLLIKNFSNFAVRISQVNTNPVKYH